MKSVNVQNVNSGVSCGATQSGNIDKDSLLSIGQKGDEIEGVITSVSDQVSINFNGKEVNVAKSSVKNATQGEIRKFKIIDISPTSIVLKEVGVNKDCANNIQAYCTKVESDQASFQKRLEESKQEQEQGEDKKKELENAASRLTSGDSEELEEEGYNYKKYELERLEKAIGRIKEQRAQKEKGIEKQIENNENFREDVEKIAKAILKTSPYAEQIIDKLEQCNLPITEANITNILKGMELSSSIPNLSNTSMEYMIDNDLEITLGNLYKASYSAYQKNSNKLSDEEFASIQSQVDTIIDKSGYEVTDETRNQARWIIENDLPLTTDTFNKLNALNTIKSNYDSKDILDKIISSLEQGLTVEDTQLADTSRDNIEKYMKDIDAISDQAIRQAVNQNKGKEITLSLLKQMQEQINKESLTSTVVDNTNFSETLLQEEMVGANDTDIKAITTKRQLEEIRLKMTVDAGQKMEAKGIHINTSALEKVVEELRNQEELYYKNLLREGNVSQTADTTAVLRDTLQKVNDLKWMPSNLLADTFMVRDSSTIQSLHEVGSNLQAKYVAANESYETLMTMPRQDMGDSIQKAFKNSMSDILTGLSLEDTQANQRAVRMLGYIGAEITKESVEQMKIYDEKVNYLIKNLTPSVTLDLIRQNKNPINTPIDILNEEITKCKEENGYTDEDGYAKYLWKLEKQGGITDSERDAYIGIYRLLHNVNKTDGAAISSLVQSGKEITLGNLLSEVRTKKTGHVNKSIDDSFGMLSEVKFKTETITDQIGKGFSNSEEDKEAYKEVEIKKSEPSTTYNQMILQDILSNITPSQVKSVLKNPEWASISLEKLKELLENQEEDSKINNQYYEEQVNEIRELAMNSDEAVDFLMNNNIPVSIQSIQEANTLINNNIYKQLLKFKGTQEAENVESSQQQVEDAVDELYDSLDRKDSIQNKMDAFAQVANQLVNEKISEADSATQINQLQLLRGAIKLSNALSKNEHYEIPLRVGESITNISLTVINGSNKESGKLSIAVQSEAFGTIQAEFSISNRSAKGLILCDNTQTSSAMKESIHSFEENIGKQNITLSQMDIGIEKVSMQTNLSKSKGNTVINKDNIEDSDQDQVTTKELYQVAKSFVVFVKQLEQDFQ